MFRCESRMRHFYEVFRHVGTSTVSTHNGLADEVRELCIIDDFQTGVRFTSSIMFLYIF